MTVKWNDLGKSPGLVPVAAAAAMLLGLVWAFWPVLTGLADRWMSDPQYSHGYLVPAFAVVLLWLRRKHLPIPPLTSSRWGLPVLLLGLGLYLAGSIIYFDWLAQVALLPCLAGVCLVLAGWPGLRWAWPSVAFLAFMLPLPHRAEGMMSHPLQRIATIASTFVLQTVGFPALAEGNTILINEHHIGVVEACNGLSMMVIFFALAVGMALVIRRPLLDKVVLVASAAPIAVVANVIRICVTGMLCVLVSGKVGHFVYHDIAGYLMMSVALAILWGELWLLSRLLVAPPPAEPNQVKAAIVGAANRSQPRKKGVAAKMI